MAGKMSLFLAWNLLQDLTRNDSNQNVTHCFEDSITQHVRLMTTNFETQIPPQVTHTEMDVIQNLDDLSLLSLMLTSAQKNHHLTQS